MNDKELINKLKEVTKELEERQIDKEAKSETYYTVGDYFFIGGKYFILGALSNFNYIILINLEDGCHWGDEMEVNDWNRVSINELNTLVDDTWKKVTKHEALTAILEELEL